MSTLINQPHLGGGQSLGMKCLLQDTSRCCRSCSVSLVVHLCRSAYDCFYLRSEIIPSPRKQQAQRTVRQNWNPDGIVAAIRPPGLLGKCSALSAFTLRDAAIRGSSSFPNTHLDSFHATSLIRTSYVEIRRSALQSRTLEGQFPRIGDYLTSVSQNPLCLNRLAMTGSEAPRVAARDGGGDEAQA